MDSDEGNPSEAEAPLVPSRRDPAPVDEVRRRREATRIVVRPIASPLSLGLFGLAAATLVLSGQQLGWVAESERKQVALILIAFSFVAQVVASVWSTLARDGVAATAMGVLALTWLAAGLVQFSTSPGSFSDGLGLFLLASALAMALNGVAASLSKVGIGLVFLTAATRFALGGLHQLTGDDGWEEAAGIVGLILFALAVYCAFAAEVEDAQGRTFLPIGRHGKGRLAVDGTLDDQLKRVPNEPGLRQQL